jgi:purine nucleosidase
MADSVPVLLDTDIGSDIDDAFALAYLLRQPNCELLGISTVTGDVAKRAALAQILCTAAGRPDIPIHAGASRVLLYGPGQPDVPQYERVQELSHQLAWPVNTAIEFMRRTIRDRPGEVTLLSLGPLTNLALLFAIDPELAGMIRSWVSMAGSFTENSHGTHDWNSVCDPVATAMAFRQPVPQHIHVGLDVTLQCRLPGEDVRTSWKGPLPALVLRMAEAWFEQEPDVVFHDPLAAALTFSPELCEYETGVVRVDPRTGQTSFKPDEAGHDRVAVSVKPQAFFDHYWSVLD